METLTCSKCGATDFEERDGMYVCKYCGAQIPKNTATETAQTAQAAQTAQTAQTAQAAPTPVQVNVNLQNTSANTNPAPSQMYVTAKSTKDWTVTLLLCIFLGYFGVHRFYTGKIGTGVLWLITLGFFGIGWIIDIIMVARGKFLDKYGRPIVHIKNQM